MLRPPGELDLVTGIFLHWFVMQSKSTTNSNIDFVLLAADELCPNSIVADLCPDAANPRFELDGQDVSLQLAYGEDQDWARSIAEADAFAIAVQYVDVITMDRLKGIYAAVSHEGNKPFGVFVYRTAGEVDYKLSCPYCGQKLWVRDTDVDKRGRCPNCKKAFILPSQSDHVRDQLQVEANIPLANIHGGNGASLKAAFRSILNGTES
jgi:hypothetical protein